jgi:hypothetical protein
MASLQHWQLSECVRISVLSGTGLRNVKGLLRRPEATMLVQRMQIGELKPGDVKGLLEAQRAKMAASAEPAA